MRSAITDPTTARLLEMIVTQVNDARATGEIRPLADLCVPAIFATPWDLTVAVTYVPLHHQTHPAPVELTTSAEIGHVETLGIIKPPQRWTVEFGDDLVGVVDGWMRVVCGQWDAIPTLLGWTDTDDAAWPTWDFRWQMNAVRAEHAVHPFTYPNCSQAIGAAPEPARRAYNVWKSLGGGVADRSLLRVDGEFRWENR